MLKIKDNVDLKELEKYGFIKNSCFYKRTYNYEYYEINVEVDLDNRYIFIQNDYYDNDYSAEIPDVIYDLIKADLVEKVGD